MRTCCIFLDTSPRLALALAVQSAPGALHLFAPVCGSWTRISRGTSLRTSINIFGDMTNEWVNTGTAMISRWECKCYRFQFKYLYPPTPAEGGGAREGLQVREPCASSSQHEPAGNRRFHCSMLLEHMHHWSRNLLRFFVAARTCRQQTRPLLHAARTHASVEPQATATYEPLWRWLTMSRSCSLRPSPSRKQGWAPKV